MRLGRGEEGQQQQGEGVGVTDKQRRPANVWLKKQKGPSPDRWPTTTPTTTTQHNIDMGGEEGGGRQRLAAHRRLVGKSDEEESREGNRRG